MRSAGDVLIILGILIVAVGIALRFAPGVLSWFGRLPGDIRLGDDRVRVFIPISSMLLVSVVLSIVLTLLLRLRR